MGSGFANCCSTGISCDGIAVSGASNDAKTPLLGYTGVYNYPKSFDEETRDTSFVMLAGYPGGVIISSDSRSTKHKDFTAIIEDDYKKIIPIEKYKIAVVSTGLNEFIVEDVNQIVSRASAGLEGLVNQGVHLAHAIKDIVSPCCKASAKGVVFGVICYDKVYDLEIEGILHNSLDEYKILCEKDKSKPVWKLHVLCVDGDGNWNIQTSLIKNRICSFGHDGYCNMIKMVPPVVFSSQEQAVDFVNSTMKYVYKLEEYSCGPNYVGGPIKTLVATPEKFDWASPKL